ncbi:hypothetical protein OSTOST_12782, partial [Ostertagia ostertagi]
MALKWSHWIFVVVNVISLPLYLLIIGVCVKEWKHNSLRRTYHLLVISHGVVDLLVMTSYFLFGVLRSSGLFNSFYWTYQQYYVASWCFNQTYVMAFIRCFGVLLISFQRYISLCRNGTYIEQMVNVSHRWKLPLLQWTFPALYSIPLLLMSNASFKDEAGLEILAEQKDIEVATSMAAAFVSITFVLCGLCYGAILKFLIVNRYSSSVALERERRLYFQMLGLFVGFTLLLVFNVMQYAFSLRSNDGPIFTMRTVFPVISCFFSYINVWMMITLNGEMRQKVLLLIGFRQPNI